MLAPGYASTQYRGSTSPGQQYTLLLVTGTCGGDALMTGTAGLGAPCGLPAEGFAVSWIPRLLHVVHVML